MKCLALFAAVLLAACASPVKFTDQGRQVRVINTGIAASCQHLGMVKAWAPVIEGGLTAAHVKIRNGVAERGGNALALTSQAVTGPGHGELIGDAYRCS